MRELALKIGTLGLLLGLVAPASAAPPRGRAPRRAPKTASKPVAKPAGPALAITRLAIEPAAATLSGPRARQHFLVTATLKDGRMLDVTDRAAFTSLSPKVARVSATGLADPVGDGQTRIVARLGGHEAAAAVTVEGAGAPATLSFVNDVMPILSKQGCNASACHGSPAGKGGFKLSLFGYEPELDQTALKDAGPAAAGALRRVNLKQPEQSLLLRKPTMAVPHGGGLRFKKGSPEYDTLLAWIKAGAPGMGQLEARVRRIDAFPGDRLLPKPGVTQRLLVTATLSDGTAVDVTDKALYSSNDDSVADVSPAGVVAARAPGETAIMIRHLGQVAVARIAVLVAVKPGRWPEIPHHNFIDDAVFAKLEKLSVLPSELANDEEFVRRAYVDTTGMIPTAEEVRAFLQDRDPKKRAKLVDQLLDRPEFVDVWTLKWNDVLRNNPRLTRLGMKAYYQWIREQVAKNVPFDQFVKSLLTATGENDKVGAVNYFLVSRDPLDLTSSTSQVFLGVRIECARCHNHPFERWTQNDYYGLAAFFSNIRRQGNGNQAPALITVGPPGRRGGGQVRNPKTGQPIEPKVLDGTEVKLDQQDLRIALADWIASPQNPFFARSIANRVWAHFMGRGIVDHVDDFRVTNPPSNPALLDALAKDLVDHKFDLKQLMRDIMNSRVYQLSSHANPYNKTDVRNFARAYPRRLTAEQLYDSISQACNAFTPFVPQGRGGGMGGAVAQLVRDAMDPNAARAHQIPVPRVPGEIGNFLDVFGRPRREVVCECERSADGSVTQALVLINSDLVTRKMEFPQGRMRQALKSARPDADTVEEFYLATLSRRPTAAEMGEAQSLIRSGRTHAEGVEDLMWGLLNSREFLFNH
jgi:hypothetical protein